MQVKSDCVETKHNEDYLIIAVMGCPISGAGEARDDIFEEIEGQLEVAE